MTLRHLRVFVAVAECGKMRAAARELFIAQPAVSQTISELEQHYDVKLFDRLSRRLHITPAGKELLTYAKHILFLYDEFVCDCFPRARCPDAHAALHAAFRGQNRG